MDPSVFLDISDLFIKNKIACQENTDGAGGRFLFKKRNDSSGDRDFHIGRKEISVPSAVDQTLMAAEGVSLSHI